jgi:hypothetical protein
MQVKTSWFFLALPALLFSACTNDKGKHIPDVSHISIDLKLERFDQALFSIDTNQMAAGLEALEARYPEFSAVFFEQLLGSKDPRIAPEGHETYMKGFISDSLVRRLYDTCQVVFPDLSPYVPEFEDALRRLQFYFPGIEVPTITAFVSEFTIANFIYGDNELAVGLDFFLGTSYPYHLVDPGNPNFSNYLVRTFAPEYLVLKTLIPLVDDLAGPAPGSRLLDYMIHNGKKLYLLDHLLPRSPDSIRLEYTAEQVAWCQANEFDIWAYFLGEELLYSTELQRLRKLVEYSPDSPGMPPEAPGRTANWTGWRIVQAYMARNPELSMIDLFQQQDAQVILDQSRYRPRR